jgi:hypothetical protein
LTTPEHLWRECAPTQDARLGQLTAADRIRTLQRVAQRCAQQAAVSHTGQFDQLADVGQPHARSRGIVHQHEIFRAYRRGQGVDPGQHRIAALGPADRGQHRLAVEHVDAGPVRIGRGQRHQQAADPRMRGEPLQRVRDQRPPSQRQVLLRAVAANPGAAPRGRHHAPRRRRAHGDPAGVAGGGGGSELPARAGCSTTW